MRLEVEHLAEEQMCTPAPDMLLVVTLIGFLMRRRGPRRVTNKTAQRARKERIKVGRGEH